MLSDEEDNTNDGTQDDELEISRFGRRVTI
jgi:hypothetical protein